jgi:hypothetical protein
MLAGFPFAITLLTLAATAWRAADELGFSTPETP